MLIKFINLIKLYRITIYNCKELFLNLLNRVTFNRFNVMNKSYIYIYIYIYIYKIERCIINNMTRMIIVPTV